MTKQNEEIRTDLLEQLDTMCKRCINYEMCQGTGCHPKKALTLCINGYTMALDTVDRWKRLP